MRQAISDTAVSPSRWHRPTFGPASEAPYRRRTSDWIRLTLAVVIVAGTCFHVGDLTPSEQELFTLFNGLPNQLSPLFEILYRFGSLWAVALIAVSALLGRRWRLARDLTIAGVAAWAIGRVLGVVIVEHEGVSGSLDVISRVGDSPHYPVVRLAVIVAVIAAASPYLTRPVRRIGQVTILLMALAALYLGTGFPNDVFAAVVLGWGAAAAVHLAFGSPGGRPTRAQVGAALAELGIDAHDVQLAHAAPRVGTVMTAVDGDGPLEMRVLGRDEADAQFLAKFWRALVYKDGGPTVHFTRLEDVEHEAYTLLLAAREGVTVPHVVAAASAGPNAALIVLRPVPGVRLADTDPAAVGDDVLDALWGQVACLRAARVAHSHLNADHIVLDGSAPALVDFSDAIGAAPEMRLAADVAELLVSTASIVGVDRAVDSAVRGLGADAAAAALPLLQPAALTRDVRPAGRRAHKDLEAELQEIRDRVAAAAGVEVPELQQLQRVDTTSLLMAVGTLIAVFALLSQIGDPQTFYDTIKDADFAWLALALAVSFATNIATAISLMGTVPIPLPLWRTAELQLSMSFSNLAVPAVGGMAAQIRFLQKQGVDLASAVASGAVLANAANIFVCIVLLGIAIVLSPTDIHTGSIPASTIVEVLVVVAILLVIVGALIWYIPKLRNLVIPQLTSALTTIGHALRSPRRVAELVIGNTINALMYAFVLLCCVEAFGGSINFWTLLAINIIVGTIASLVPIPGGGTAVGAVGMSGALTAAGVPTEVAVAAVLANQLVGSFIPAVPGWVATRNLLAKDYL